MGYLDGTNTTITVSNNTTLIGVVNQLTVSPLGDVTMKKLTTAKDFIQTGVVIKNFKNVVGRTPADALGAGSFITTANDALGTLNTNMFLPSKGTFARIRTGTPTASITETLPSTASIITDVSADLPGGVWNIGDSYEIWWIYNSAISAKNWFVNSADANTIFKQSSSQLGISSSNSTIAAYYKITIMRISNTQILIWI